MFRSQEEEVRRDGSISNGGVEVERGRDCCDNHSLGLEIVTRLPIEKEIATRLSIKKMVTDY